MRKYFSNAFHASILYLFIIVFPSEFGNPKLGPNGKPMVKCEVCGKELADPSSLYRHRKIHSGEKPHSCPFCIRRFIQRYNMRQHLKTHKNKVTQEQINSLEPDLQEVFRNNQ